jgi:ketosteroid isomerase-like protein
VEIAKRVVEAFNGRDAAAASELTTPDFEWFPAMATSVEGGSYRGDEGIRRYLAEVNETWDELRLVVDEFRDLGDRVLMFGRIQGRGRGSGVPAEAALSGIVDFRDRLIWRSRNYVDQGEALRAAGLTE